MKISERFCLNKTQYELDFVDIDTDGDLPLFVDPRLIRKYKSSDASLANIVDAFFSELISTIGMGRAGLKRAQELCQHLREVNETHLGLSRGESNGRGVGPLNAKSVLNAIKDSPAMDYGILQHVEDLRVMVNGLDRDLLSDMLTNIIKQWLLVYTIRQCELHKIPLTATAPSGFFWDHMTKTWDEDYIQRLIVEDKPVLLVPKRLVSYASEGTSEKYRRHFVLNFLQEENIINETVLVRHRSKTGDPFVTKKSIIDNDPSINKKEFLCKFTEKHPEIYSEFKTYSLKVTNPLPGGLMANIDMDGLCNFLAEKLASIPCGQKNASIFHNLMVGILELLFYPNLTNPTKEREINEGRKRIDIVFTNNSEKGFFCFVQDKLGLPCPIVSVECKNYKEDIANPELDQLIGRFSDRRGRVGILSCRNIDDEKLFLARCSDTYKDGHGLIIPLADQDILRCLRSGKQCMEELEEVLLEKVQVVISG